jgi:hypothetical protein
VIDIESGVVEKRECYDYSGPVERCDPATIGAIAAIIGAGTAAGGTIYSAVNAPSGPPKPSTTLTPLTGTQNQAQTASVANALPTLQSLTGGSLSPEYAAQFGATQSGLANDPQAPGNIQAAINSFFGLTAPGNSGLTPSSSSGGSDILSLLSNATPGATPSLTGATTGGDGFRGLVG